MRVLIESRQALGKTTITLENKLVRLKVAIEKNPVHEMVSDGLFTSIVEEFGKDEQTLRRKGTRKLLNKIGHFTGSRFAIKVFQEGYMVPGSQTGQLALMATQHGDFVGRFVMYNWNTNIMKMDRRDAMHESLDSFIYYNLPQN